MCCLALVSCGKREHRYPVYPVTGKVLFRNQPARGAFVVFHPVEELDRERLKMLPCGRVGDDGTFRLTSYDTEDGAPAGEYIVVIIWPAKAEGMSDEEEGPYQLQGRFARPDVSSLRAKVTEGENVLKAFELQ
jgi:hypothetical protein